MQSFVKIGGPVFEKISNKIMTLCNFDKDDDLTMQERTIRYWIILVSPFILLAFSVQIGVQSMPDLLSRELYPGDFRAKGKAMNTATTSIWIFLTLKLYSPLKDCIGDYGVFYLFAGALLCSLPLVYLKNLCKIDGKKDNDGISSNWFYMPETKGILLEEVQYFYIPRTVPRQEEA